MSKLKVARGRGNQGDWAGRNSGSYIRMTDDQLEHNAAVEVMKAEKKARRTTKSSRKGDIK